MFPYEVSLSGKPGDDGQMSFYPLDCQFQNHYIAATGAQSK